MSGAPTELLQTLMGPLQSGEMTERLLLPVVSDLEAV